jgi:hypothetical protein
LNFGGFGFLKVKGALCREQIGQQILFWWHAQLRQAAQ